ncbi:hypothetical protein SISNIDRAFT_551014 [Sistotremastrum niveocremeum HHB9708]|uniref:Zn(2)-C6 fungal-type domain-containing protein n=1 Tax=Sistotremastrum niveocremeum HHB9708 TaxID=1314777 RepID=A0A164SIT2_9AGAM|nr:hypothetical protein SISNIDRAFT_551014 [Sistotremastrum niveocremeum HHB9708]
MDDIRSKPRNEAVDDIEMDKPGQARQGKNTDQSKRTRITRACDQCRGARTKCEPMSDEDSCHMCFRLGIECVYTTSCRKRGPPKGYLKLVESRLYEAEAIIGVLQSLPDRGVQYALRQLNSDPLAGRVLDRIANTPFGPLGRNKLKDREAMREEGHEMEDGAVKGEGPSTAWQENLISTIRPLHGDLGVESEEEVHTEEPPESETYSSSFSGPHSHSVSYIRSSHSSRTSGLHTEPPISPSRSSER